MQLKEMGISLQLEKGQPICFQINSTGIEYMYWELEPKPQVQLHIGPHSAKGFHQVQVVVDKTGLTKGFKDTCCLQK